MTIPPESFKIDSLEELQKFAEVFKNILQPGNLVFLNGALGSGKTTFVKYLVAGYNINNATSPSYTLINEYHGSCPIAHADFYRIKSHLELNEIGIQEYLDSDEYIVLIEWAELFADFLPSPDFTLKFYFGQEMERRVQLIEF